MNHVRVVIVTYPVDFNYWKIAEEIIDNGLASSINMVEVNSIYYWEKRINRGREVLFIIKTHSSIVDRLKEFISSTHPYKVPQIIEITPTDVHKPYSDWVEEVTVRRRWGNKA